MWAAPHAQLTGTDTDTDTDRPEPDWPLEPNTAPTEQHPYPATTAPTPATRSVPLGTLAGFRLAAACRAQAIERILAVLESVSRSPGGLLPARVAEETGLSLSTVLRLMQSLEDDEVLHRSSGSSNYQVGSRLIGIVDRSTRSFDSRIAAVPLLERLRDSSGGETSSLHVRSGNQRVCVAGRVRAVARNLRVGRSCGRASRRSSAHDPSRALRRVGTRRSRGSPRRVYPQWGPGESGPISVSGPIARSTADAVPGVLERLQQRRRHV
ncbi:hypothetical protein CA951_41215 [Rhodococcus sp. NCIMB 12038]|nr:hypothetical protein CA951_41215 [Rhodococcus sp. NCIMB 12038]